MVDDADTGLPCAVPALNGKAEWTSADDLPSWDPDEYANDVIDGLRVEDNECRMALAVDDVRDARWTGDLVCFDDGVRYLEVCVDSGAVVARDRRGGAEWVCLTAEGRNYWQARLDEIVKEERASRPDPEDYTEPLAAFACPSCGVQVGVHEDDAADAQPLEWSSAECPACGNLAVVMPSVDSPGEGWVRSWGFEPSPDGDPRLPEDAQGTGTTTNLTIRLVEVGTSVGGVA